jgi:hypothetical protein
MSSTLPGNENEVIHRFSFGILLSHLPDLAQGRDTRYGRAVTETFNCSCLSAYLGDDEIQGIVQVRVQKGKCETDIKLHSCSRHYATSRKVAG